MLQRIKLTDTNKLMTNREMKERFSSLLAYSVNGCFRLKQET